MLLDIALRGQDGEKIAFSGIATMLALVLKLSQVTAPDLAGGGHGELWKKLNFPRILMGR